MINKDLGLVTAYAYAVSKGYTGTEEEFAELMASYASVAEQAEESAEDSEAWAIGKRGGQDVPSTDEAYHNNAKYYAEQAGTSAGNAASSASAASASESNAAASASSAAGSASSATTSAATATEKAGEASASASAASTSAASAAGSATNAASSATAASASATAAGNAQTAAETAQGKAEDAQEAAEQAQSDAEAAAQSVSQSAAQISQNTSDISNLKSAIEEIRSSGTKNLFNDDVISLFDGVSFSNGVFSGAANKFDHKILMQTGFDPNTQYAISLYGKNTGVQTTGNGLGIRVNYTDETYGISYLRNSQTEDFGRLVVLSEADRTISSVQFEYNAGGANVWNVKDIQIEKGSSATNYVPYYTAYDRLARDTIEIMSDSIESVENLAVQGGEISIDSLINYQSFDDLPINKIVHLVGNLKLNNAPPGYVDIGHNNMDSGLYQGLVFTYSAKTNRSSIVQKCVYYNNNYDYDKLPRTATRYGFLVNGSITWTDWSVISENTVLHGSDKVVDVNTYSTVTFGDFNDAPPNAIFQVDLNCGNTVLNNPSPGNSGVLMTFAFSPIQRHALVQNHYALENDRICMYIRYGYKQSASEFIWTSWEKVVTEQQL